MKKVPKTKENVKKMEKFLYNLGIRPDYKGFAYIEEILFRYINTEQEDLPFISIVNLYSETANFFNVYSTNGAWKSIERNVRTSVKSMRKQNTPLYKKLFGRMDPNRTIRNKDFITTCVEYLKLYVFNSTYINPDANDERKEIELLLRQIVREEVYNALGDLLIDKRSKNT